MVFLIKNFMSSELINITANITVKFKDFEETYTKIRAENHVITKFFKEEI